MNISSITQYLLDHKLYVMIAFAVVVVIVAVPVILSVRKPTTSVDKTSLPTILDDHATTGVGASSVGVGASSVGVGASSVGVGASSVGVGASSVGVGDGSATTVPVSIINSTIDTKINDINADITTMTRLLDTDIPQKRAELEKFILAQETFFTNTIEADKLAFATSIEPMIRNIETLLGIPLPVASNAARLTRPVAYIQFRLRNTADPVPTSTNTSTTGTTTTTTTTTTGTSTNTLATGTTPTTNSTTTTTGSTGPTTTTTTTGVIPTTTTTTTTTNPPATTTTPSSPSGSTVTGTGKIAELIARVNAIKLKLDARIQATGGWESKLAALIPDTEVNSRIQSLSDKFASEYRDRRVNLKGFFNNTRAYLDAINVKTDTILSKEVYGHMDYINGELRNTRIVNMKNHTFCQQDNNNVILPGMSLNNMENRPGKVPAGDDGYGFTA